MKTILLIFSVAFTLCTSAVNAGAHGCGFHFWIGIPFLFGIGFGGPCGYPYTCGYPVYSPSRVDSSQTHSASATATTQAPAPQVPQLWMPSTPGTGGWVHDPEPYRFTSTLVPKTTTVPASNGAETVSTSKSSDGIMVYQIKPQAQ